jgi:hypothetical protein
MATPWRRRLAERSLATHNKFIPRQKTWFVRFKEKLIPTRCERRHGPAHNRHDRRPQQWTPIFLPMLGDGTDLRLACGRPEKSDHFPGD